MDEIVPILALLALSFLFSGSEVALFSLTPVHKRRLRGTKVGSIILRLLSSPFRLLATILLGNTAVNSFASSLFAVISADLFSRLGIIIQAGYVVDIIFFTVVLLIAGEITPKILAIKHSEGFSKRAAYFLYPIYIVLLPISYPFSVLLDKLMQRTSTAERPLLEEIIYVIKRAKDEGKMTNEEYRVIREGLNILTAPVREYMVPRKEIVAIQENTKLGDALVILKKIRHSRYPVYRTNLDEITGILDFPYIVKKGEIFDYEKPVRDYIRPALFVPETTRLIDLLKKFRRMAEKIAIVVDEYGGTAGIITAWDIEREIIGEIKEEPEPENIEDIKRIGEDTFIVPGDLDIEQLSELLNVQLGTEGTVAGFIMEITGRIPEEGERVEFNGVYFEVLKKSGETIESLKVSRK